MSQFYRLLNEGEPIQQGDEIHCGNNCWGPVLFTGDLADKDFKNKIIRRPLGSGTCDHILGLERDWDYSRLQPKSDGPLDADGKNELFNFCPLCGMPLEVKE